MFTSSEAAMEANLTVSFAIAGAELQKHGVRWARPIDLPEVATAAQNDTHILVWGVSFSRDEKRSEGWECIPRTTKAILEWLGY